MSKKNIVLVIVLAVLVAVAYLYQGPFQDWRRKAGQPKNFLSKSDFSLVEKFDISDHGQKMTAEKIGDKWKIAGTKDFYVSDSKIDSLATAISEVAKADLELVSNDKGKKKDLMVDESGTDLKLYAKGGATIEMVFGKSTGDSNARYLSVPDTDKTYAVKTDLPNILDLSDGWYDKQIFAGKKEDINRLRIQYPNSEFSLEKGKDDKWAGILPFKFNVDSQKVDKILDIMSSLIAAKIPEQTFKGTGLEKNALIVAASGTTLNNVLMIGDKDKDGYYYAKKGDSDNIYLITKEQRDDLAKTMKDLK